jgi:hypothetical protein
MPSASPAEQRTARTFGVLFALTFVTSIAALLLYDPVLNDADYILGNGADTRLNWARCSKACSPSPTSAPRSSSGPSSGRVLRRRERAAARLPLLRIRPCAAVDRDVRVVGGPLIFASAIAVLFGAYEQDGAHFLFSIPEIVFESRAPDRRLGCRLEPVELEIDMDAEHGTPSTRKRGWLPATRHIQRA